MRKRQKTRKFSSIDNSIDLLKSWCKKQLHSLFDFILEIWGSLAKERKFGRVYRKINRYRRIKKRMKIAIQTKSSGFFSKRFCPREILKTLKLRCSEFFIHLFVIILFLCLFIHYFFDFFLSPTEVALIFHKELKISIAINYELLDNFFF